MDFKRKIYDELTEWKQRSNHKPLIVDGLRQVGKSYIVDKFATENYLNKIVFDFRHRPELRNCFINSQSIDDILSKASPYFPEQKFIPYDTILVFEEIGDCDEARTSLKPFCMDGRFDVICTGSLLGVSNYRHKKKLPIPAGYEEYISMSSMDFEEFLWAFNTPLPAIQKVKDSILSHQELDLATSQFMKEMMMRYIAIGGMPDVVKAFISSGNDYSEARRTQLNLIQDYKSDFGRFIDDNGDEVIDYKLQVQLNQVFDSIPKQLSRETGNFRFRFAELEKGARASKFEMAVDWLEKAGLILRVFNTKAIESPLLSNADSSIYKIFISDIGLLMALYPISTLQEFLAGTLGSRKGALYENLAATLINKAGFPLFYYGNSDTHLEIDFLLETMDGITLYEEKSNNGKMNASRNVMEGKTPYKANKCIKIVQDGFGEGSFFFTIPQYAAPFYLFEEQSKLNTKIIANPLPKLN